MSRFFIPPDKISENKIYVDSKPLRHIRKVMRLQKGDTIVAFDGTGREYIGVIEQDLPKSAIIDIKKTIVIKRERQISISVAQAIPKKDTMDYIVTKSTELGVDEILPIITERTIARPKLKDFDLKRTRWERIAAEAARQCGRLYLPKISNIAFFKDFLKQIKDFELILIPTLDGERIALKNALNEKPKNVLVIIGPEGDFTKREVAQAKKAGAIAVTLGENVLRCDTAAIYVLSVLSYELER